MLLFFYTVFFIKSGIDGDTVDVAFGLLVSVGSGDKFHIAHIAGSGRLVVLVSIHPLVTTAVDVVLKLGGVPVFLDTGGFVKGAVHQCTTIAGGHITVGIVLVADVSDTGMSHRMNTSTILAVGVGANISFGGDIAQPVVGVTIHLTAND